MPREARSFFLLSLDASSIWTLITLDSLTVLEQMRCGGEDQDEVNVKQGMQGRNGDKQIKGFVPIRSQRLFDRRRHCGVHAVHTEVGDWIGQAEDIPFDEFVRGNDCKVISVSILAPLSVVLDGRAPTSQFDRLRPRFPPTNRQYTLHSALTTLLHYSRQRRGHSKRAGPVASSGQKLSHLHAPTQARHSTSTASSYSRSSPYTIISLLQLDISSSSSYFVHPALLPQYLIYLSIFFLSTYTHHLRVILWCIYRQRQLQYNLSNHHIKDTSALSPNGYRLSWS